MRRVVEFIKFKNNHWNALIKQEINANKIPSNLWAKNKFNKIKRNSKVGV